MKIYFRFFFLLLPFLFACKAKKNLPPSTAVKCRLDYKSAKTLSSLLKKNEVQYTTFSGKIKTIVTAEDKSSDFTLSLRMKKDSIIWASISSFGIEGMRLVATKDSIRFIDRLHNKYFIGDYDTLSQLLRTEIDLEILQSLLVGNSVDFYTEDEKLRSGIDSCKYLLGTIRKRKLRKMIRKGKEFKEPAQNIWLLDSTFKISRILFREFESNREFDASFRNFQNAEIPENQPSQISVPFNIDFIIKANTTILVNLQYTKASANKPQTFPFSIPEGYERIEKK